MRHKFLPVWLWLAGLVLCAGLDARASYRTDMGDFLPPAHNLGQAALQAQVSGGGAAHLMLVALDGAPPPVLAQVSEALAAKLRPAPDFAAVLNGDAASLAGTQDFVWRNRYLLSPEQNFSTPALHAALLSDLAMLSSEMSGVAAQTLPADPTGAALGLLQGLGNQSGPQTQDGVWFSPDARNALLLLHTAAPGFDLDAQQHAQATLAAALAAARGQIPGAGAVRLRATGPGVFAVQTRDVTKRDVTRLSALATAGAVLFLLLAYRSPRALLLGLLPVASGALAGIAAVSLVFGFVHAITLGFGVTLIGEAMDYSVYLLTQKQRDEPGAATMARLWPTLRLGALTSIAGFAAMLGSSFTGFAQLGLFSMAGLAAAALVTRFVLPRLVPAGFFAGGAAGIGWPLRLALRRRRLLQAGLGGLAGLAVLSLALHRGPLWATDLLSLSPLPPATQALDTALRAELGIADPRDFLAWRAATQEQALATSAALQPALDRLAAGGALRGYSLPSQILPSAADQRARRAALPDDATLHANFAAALAGLPFRAGAFAPFFADVAAARAAPLLDEASLPPPLALRLHAMLAPDGRGWIVLAPLQGVTDPQAVQAALAPGIAFVDLNAQSAGLLAVFEHEAVALALCGSFAILLILALALRSAREVARVAAPLALAVLLTAAVLTLGGPLSIFMVAGFMLIVAVGSNYCLFFAKEAAPAARERALASIMLANLCTVAAYGLLSRSAIPVLHDIGETVALGTFLCLLCGAAFSARAP